ncbi:MAG: HAMP domain-containing histidine kinase [Candidatus Synoicihabitans palmerolidicus]|nr:HAMP domain-containing histidine kinase [Candidatus Synoicihabitans palmerolidicus]
MRRNAEAIERAVQRLVSIIKQLSSMVVKTRMPTERFLLSDLLDGAIRRFEQETDAKDVVILSNPLEDLVIDSHVEVFESAISALLTNGWEASGTTIDRQA